MNTSNRSGLVIGTLLVFAGVLFLADQLFNIHIATFTWPLLVIGFGGAFFLGMILGGKAMGGLAIPGSIISGIGLLLLVQNTFNLWESWSYSWALIICFVGLGMVIYGSYSDLPEMRARGYRTLRVGAILLLVFGGIFGVLLSLSNAYGMKSSLIWAVGLMALGLWMLVTRTLRLFRHSDEPRRRDTNLFWPVILIGAGALWLLVAINVLPGEQALALLNLWPVLLIAAGVDLLFGRRFAIVNLVLGVLVVAMLFVYAFAGTALGLPRLTWYNGSMINFGIGLPLQHINGSGRTAIEGREVGGFERIKINTIGEAEIIQGENEGIIIEAEDNLIPYITSNVLGGEMVIDVKPGAGISPTKPIRYKITLKNLKEVHTSGASKVTIQPMTVNQLNLASSGTGEFTLTDLTATSLTVSISGAGAIKASGTSTQTDIRISGTGSVNAPDLKSTTASINISGMGSATLWVTEKLNTNISGAGSISYYGSPVLTQVSSGIGSVNKLGTK